MPKWRILVGLAIVWLVLTVVYAIWYVNVPAESNRTFETVRFLTLSISGFGVLFTALLASFNSLEASANVASRMAFDKTENSFEYIRRWDSEVLREARDWTRRIKAERTRLSDEDLIEKINSDEGLLRSVITMFNFFEEMELAMQAERVQDSYLRRAFSVIYPDIHERFRTWIDSDVDDSQKGHLLVLYQRWTRLSGA